MTPEKFDALLDMVAPKIEGCSITTSDVGSDLFLCQLETTTALCNIFSEFRRRLFLTLYQSMRCNL
jgi:hypothetical protein